MYAVVVSPSFTLDGPEIDIVIGSLADMLAVALDAPLFTVTCEEGRVVVIAPSVTVKPSATSDSASSVAVIVILCVDPAAEFAAKVTVPDVAPRSDASAASVPSGADHATCTWDATACERVTVKVASDPSATLDAGPTMDSVAVSLSSVGVVVLLSSVRVTVAELTLSPTCVVVVPGIVIVSSPSTTASSVGVMVSVPVALAELAGMVMLASAVFTA